MADNDFDDLAWLGTEDRCEDPRGFGLWCK
jgi:hypothetical protein